MNDILNIILPVFLLILTGYGAVQLGYLNEAIATHLNAFAVRLAVPVLLFQAIYLLDFSQAIRWQILTGFYVGAFSSFFITLLVARLLFSRRPGEAVVVGFAATFSNSVLLGVSVAERAFGPDMMPLVFGIVAFHAPSVYILGLTAMEFSRSDGRDVSGALRAATKSILGNALMIAILSAAVLNLSGIQLPGPVLASIKMIAAAAIPAALIAIGAALPAYRIKSELSETLLVSFMSLIFHPAVALFITWSIFDLPREWVQIAVLIAAMPPGINIYIFATMFNRAVALSASAFVVATTLSLFTITSWLYLLKNLL